MESAGGLTRRRGGGGGTSAIGDDESDPSRVNSPTPKAGIENRNSETSYTGGENGHKIAFDPRDISETEERNKQPKLTLMEEVLLLGLKDKQVLDHGWGNLSSNVLTFNYLRAIFHSGMTIYHTLYEDASSSSSLSGVA